jgi:hypothetical protein
MGVDLPLIPLSASKGAAHDAQDAPDSLQIAHPSGWSVGSSRIARFTRQSVDYGKE